MTSRSVTARLREVFSFLWRRPAPTKREAARILSRAAKSGDTQSAAYVDFHDRLRAERAAGWPGRAA